MRNILKNCLYYSPLPLVGAAVGIGFPNVDNWFHFCAHVFGLSVYILLLFTLVVFLAQVSTKLFLGHFTDQVTIDRKYHTVAYLISFCFPSLLASKLLETLSPIIIFSPFPLTLIILLIGGIKAASHEGKALKLNWKNAFAALVSSILSYVLSTLGFILGLSIVVAAAVKFK